MIADKPEEKGRLVVECPGMLPVADIPAWGM